MFNEKFDLKLIKLVKTHAVLYNTNDAKYMDLNAREVAWQKIGDELKRPAFDCKTRWIHIRDVHRRILRKSLNNPGLKMRPYKYESPLAFMRPFYRDMLIQNVDDDDDDINDSHEVDKEVSDNAATESDDSEKPVKKRPKTRKKKKKTVEANSIQPQTPSFESVSVSELDSRDPIDAFLLGIGATLKSFTPYHLNLAKSKIFSIVQEHELQQIMQGQRNDIQPCEMKMLSSQNNMFLSNC